ncbi:MAG: hypothetical protein GXO78_10935 [Calditrichaeota bacterium]|nr:hypothetical protein [Calditrichota bacterium]
MQTVKQVAKLALVTILFWIWGCGGSRPLAENRTPLGLVPFVAGKTVPAVPDLNRELVQALVSSGSFDVVVLDQRARLLDATQLSQLSTNQTVKFILTGKFLEEVELVGKGKNIPLVAYLPRKQIKVNLEFRLFDVEKKGWKAIRQVSAVAGMQAGVQVTAFDPSDPALAITAKERVVLREQAYARLFQKFVRLLEEEMEIKR